MLNEKILADLKQAMLKKDALNLSVLRMLLSAVKNKMVAMGGGGKNPLTDEQIIEVIGSEIKKRKDSIEAYLSGGRPELAEREKAEIEVLSAYMPAQLGPDELENIVKDAIAGLGDVSAKDFGRVMGALMPRVKGKADGAAVTAAVKKILGS